jgi:hypothetical protein
VESKEEPFHVAISGFGAAECEAQPSAKHGKNQRPGGTSHVRSTETI